MANLKLTERVTIDRDVTGVIRDLVLFARFLVERNKVPALCSNEELVALARDFWDREHGE